MKTFLKRLFGLGALAAAGYALWRAYDRRRLDTGISWDSQPFPYPPEPHRGAEAPAPATREPATATADGWVEPDDGTCPASHPVKAKLASGIFHIPGGANYERTRADRCYVSAASAESDGLRPSKR